MRAYRQQVRSKIIEAKQQGLSSAIVSRRYGVTTRTVERYWKRYRETSEVGPKQMGGYRRSKLAEHDATLEKWIEAEPDLSLAELQERCAEQFDLKVSVHALWYRLRRIGLSYKKNDARRRARQA